MNQFTHPEGLSMLEKRRIEAEILKEVYETLKESHGEEVARKTIAESVRRSAIEQARQFAASAPGGTSLKAFQDVMPLWTKGGALEIEVKEQTEETFTFTGPGVLIVPSSRPSRVSVQSASAGSELTLIACDVPLVIEAQPPAAPSRMRPAPARMHCLSTPPATTRLAMSAATQIVLETIPSPPCRP